VPAHRRPRGFVVLATLPALLLGSALTTPAAGQTGRQPATGQILGTVIESDTGRPVQGATVSLDADGVRPVITNDAGRFVFARVPARVYELRVEHIAFGSVRHLVNVPADRSVEIEVEVAAQAIALDPVVVRVELRNQNMERGGYYERRDRASRGHFIEGRNLQAGFAASSVLRQVPRVEIRQVGRSVFERVVVFRSGVRDCIPEIFIDGHFMAGAAGDLDMFVGAGDIEAIEVYRGIETPGEFIRRPRQRVCGAIVVWTKR
jgi:hypothetical protein